MKAFYEPRFPSEELKRAATLWRLVIILAFLTRLPVGLAAAQDIPSQPQTASIHGVVLDSNGKPVSTALVRLEQKGGQDAVATTSSDGAFAFSGIQYGTYQVSAEKSGQRSRVTAAIASATAQESLQLVLDSNSSLSSAPDPGMAFADKPNFTVAGITDWTAVGGHGSDSSLRTSEDLARETTTLKPESVGHATPNTSIMSADKESEAKLRATLVASPHSFEANRQLGKFCLQMKSYREAVSLLDTAYKIDPANHDNEFDLALAYKGSGDFSQARGHIQNLLTREDNADFRRMLGDLDEAMGDSLESVREYEQAARLDPSEQNYFAWGSELLLHRAVWPAAEVFKKGSEAYPKSARMLAALGAALFASALYDEAALRLCEASDLNPVDPTPYLFLGKIDMAAPSPLSCVETKLRRFLGETPGDARANYYYAMVIWKRQKGLENLQEMQQVESLLTKAVITDPRYGEAYLQLGNFYAGKKNFDKAISFYTKAIEIDPQLSEAHYRLGVVYERRGESAKAQQEFQLHDEIEKAQSAAIERQRREVKQFLVVLQGRPTVH